MGVTVWREWKTHADSWYSYLPAHQSDPSGNTSASSSTLETSIHLMSITTPACIMNEERGQSRDNVRDTRGARPRKTKARDLPSSHRPRSQAPPPPTSFLIHPIDSDINPPQSRNGTRIVRGCVDAIHHQIHSAYRGHSVLHQQLSLEITSSPTSRHPESRASSLAKHTREHAFS